MSGVDPCFAAWAVGVGSSAASSPMFGFLLLNRADRGPAGRVGVPSNAEPSASEMRRSGFFSRYNTCPSHITQSGKRCNDSGAAESKEPCDVLQDDDSGSKNANTVGDVGEDCSLIVRAFPLPCMGERLAWKPGAQDVDRFDLVPVDRGQVAEVRHTGPMMVEHLRTVFVDLGVPGEGRAVMMLDGHI